MIVFSSSEIGVHWWSHWQHVSSYRCSEFGLFLNKIKLLFVTYSINIMVVWQPEHHLNDALATGLRRLPHSQHLQHRQRGRHHRCRHHRCSAVRVGASISSPIRQSCIGTCTHVVALSVNMILTDGTILRWLARRAWTSTARPRSTISCGTRDWHSTAPCTWRYDWISRYVILHPSFGI